MTNVHSTSKRMPFQLGNQTIVPINDGSIEIVYQNDERKRVSWKGGMPLLSIEVIYSPPPDMRINLGQAKRRVAKSRRDPELLYRHAAQIFCEMLGQTCHPEFFTNSEMTYQEVPPTFFSFSFFFEQFLTSVRLS